MTLSFSFPLIRTEKEREKEKGFKWLQYPRVLTPGIGKTFSCPDLSRLSVTKRYPLYFAAPRPLLYLFSDSFSSILTLHAVANVASRHSARSSFARTLADSSRVISLATSRGRITPYVLRDFTWAETCRDVEKNDIPRSLSRKTVDAEREKKLRIFSPCLLSSKGFFFFLFRNNVVPFSPIV